MAINTRKIKLCYDQFGLWGGMQRLLFELARRILDPALIPSYSQTGEDRILSALLGESKTGYYVDVGCNDPKHWSNTFAFYCRGWTGVCIDAATHMIDRYAKARPRDRAVCSPVSDTAQTLAFTEFENPCVSSLSPEHVKEWTGRCAVRNVRQVQTESLTKILERAGAPRCFDLLSIDVEGHDLEVLNSLDFNRHRPRVIVIEIHGFCLSRPADSAIYRLLRDRNYELVGYALMNAYFSSKE